MLRSHRCPAALFLGNILPPQNKALSKRFSESFLTAAVLIFHSFLSLYEQSWDITIKQIIKAHLTTIIFPKKLQHQL